MANKNVYPKSAAAADAEIRKAHAGTAISLSALREQAAGLRRAQALAKLAHVITKPDGSFESWSETLPDLVGVHPDEVVSSTRKWLDLVHVEDRERFRQTALQALREGKRADVEYRLCRKDGAWIHVRQVMEPIPGDADAQGRTRWFNTLQDVTEQKRAEAALRDSESLKSAILESSLDALVTIDPRGNIVEFNPAAEAMFGISRERALGQSMAQLIIPPHLRDAHLRGFSHYHASGEGPVFGKRLELEAMRADGTVFPVELAITPTRSRSGQLFTGCLRDITKRKAAEAKIKRLNRVYAVLSGINTLIVRAEDRDEIHRESCRIAVQQGEFRMAWLGILERETDVIEPVASHGEVRDFLQRAPLASQGKRVGMAWQAILEKRAVISNDVQNDPRTGMKKACQERGINSLAFLPLIVDGEGIGVLALYAAETGFFDDEEMKLLGELAGDISFALDHIQKAERLDYLAYYDSLTGLANRTLFLERLKQLLHPAGPVQTQLALIVVDIERFRTVNDTFGRHAGDALLKLFAARMLEVVRDPVRLARLGADHFAVVADVRAEGDVASMMENARTRVLSEPFAIEGTELRIATKAGIALFPNDGADGDALLANAEAALRKAKATGERELFYTEAMTERVAERLTLENKLRQALEKHEFVLHYQPKVDVENRKIVGVEALLRWDSPELGLVPPLRFISLMEETGLILEVGSWAIKQASFDHRQWAEQGFKELRVAVNVSAIQLRKRSFVSLVEEAIIDGLAPTGIDLEITESLLMDSIEANIEKLQALRRLGINVSIDDFGTGYSSLAYLAKLPVQTLKIDRSFVNTMNDDPNAMTLVSTIISLAHSLKLKVVAEGVETEEQAKFLRLLRCDEMQGYLISKPLPFDELMAFLRQQASNDRKHPLGNL
jgi:diguanylate cyclase (GGDEF)-like protein/PAS domain S-box-containing protein